MHIIYIYDKNKINSKELVNITHGRIRSKEEGGCSKEEPTRDFKCVVNTLFLNSY